MEEMVKFEEKKLLDSIDFMNKGMKRVGLNFNSYPKENIDPNTEDYDMLKSINNPFTEKRFTKRSYSLSALENLDESDDSNPRNNSFTNSFLSENDIVSSLYNKLSPMISKNSTLSTSNSTENSMTLEIMNKNLINFDEILKFIVIGEKAVGKSLLISKIISNDTEYKGKYIPTER